MVQVPYFQVDAFSAGAFSGNPAGVCLLDGWLSDAFLQSIAAENNQPESVDQSHVSPPVGKPRRD